MVDDYTDRRTILRAVGIGITVSVAGCSGDENSPPNAEDADDSTTSDEGTSTDSETQTEQNSGDVIQDGEEDLEDYISTAENSEHLPEGREVFPPLGRSEYMWIKFEEVSDQIDLNYEGFENHVPSNLEDRGRLNFDTYYLALREESEEYDTAWAGINLEEWEEGSPVAYNSGKGEYSPQSVNMGSLESFLSEGVRGYSDASSDVPDEYLERIGE